MAAVVRAGGPGSGALEAVAALREVCQSVLTGTSVVGSSMVDKLPPALREILPSTTSITVPLRPLEAVADRPQSHTLDVTHVPNPDALGVVMRALGPLQPEDVASIVFVVAVSALRPWDLERSIAAWTRVVATEAEALLRRAATGGPSIKSADSSVSAASASGGAASRSTRSSAGVAAVTATPAKTGSRGSAGLGQRPAASISAAVWAAFVDSLRAAQDSRWVTQSVPATPQQQQQQQQRGSASASGPTSFESPARVALRPGVGADSRAPFPVVILVSDSQVLRSGSSSATATTTDSALVSAVKAWCASLTGTKRDIVNARVRRCALAARAALVMLPSQSSAKELPWQLIDQDADGQKDDVVDEEEDKHDGSSDGAGASSRAGALRAVDRAEMIRAARTRLRLARYLSALSRDGDHPGSNGESKFWARPIVEGSGEGGHGDSKAESETSHPTSDDLSGESASLFLAHGWDDAEIINDVDPTVHDVPMFRGADLQAVLEPPEALSADVAAAWGSPPSSGDAHRTPAPAPAAMPVHASGSRGSASADVAADTDTEQDAETQAWLLSVAPASTAVRGTPAPSAAASGPARGAAAGRAESASAALGAGILDDLGSDADVVLRARPSASSAAPATVPSAAPASTAAPVSTGAPAAAQVPPSTGAGAASDSSDNLTRKPSTAGATATVTRVTRSTAAAAAGAPAAAASSGGAAAPAAAAAKGNKDPTAFFRLLAAGDKKKPA